MGLLKLREPCKGIMSLVLMFRLWAKGTNWGRPINQTGPYLVRQCWPSPEPQNTQTHTFSAQSQCSFHCTTHRGESETSQPAPTPIPPALVLALGVSCTQGGVQHTRRCVHKGVLFHNRAQQTGAILLSSFLAQTAHWPYLTPTSPNKVTGISLSPVLSVPVSGGFLVPTGTSQCSFY